MKITQEPKDFKPVTIILESLEEAKVLLMQVSFEPSVMYYGHSGLTAAVCTRLRLDLYNQLADLLEENNE